MQVSKWGNSLAVRLPVAVVSELGLKEGDDISISVVGPRTLKVSRERTREEALASIRRLRRPLPEGWKFDRDEANER